MPLKDHEALKAYHRAYYAKNRDKCRAVQATWRGRNATAISARLRENAYRRRYGITVAEYEAMLAA